MTSLNSNKQDAYFRCKDCVAAFDSGGDKTYQQIMDAYNKHKPSRVWTSYLSITQEDCVSYGLLEKKDFAHLTERVVMHMCKELNISVNEIEWGGFYHTDKENHPHVHFYIYNRNAPNLDRLLTSQQLTKLRSCIASELVNRSDIFKLKDASRSKLIQAIKQKNEDRYHGILPHGYMKLYNKLCKELPTSGRMSYNSSNIIPYKQDIDTMIDMILKNKEFMMQYGYYKSKLQTVVESNKNLYGNVNGKKHTDYIKDQNHRLYTEIGNMILSSIKEYRHNHIVIESTFTSHEKQDAITLNKRLQKTIARKDFDKSKVLLKKNIRLLGDNFYARNSIRNMVAAAREEEKSREETEHEH